MQTFMPYADIRRSLSCLDYRRLGKQRVEAFQIQRVIEGISSAWANHPAVKMWRGYLSGIKFYKCVAIEEWINRGYKNTMVIDWPKKVTFPLWIGDEKVHVSHQSNLIRKFPSYYASQFPGVPNDLPYYWPVL